jgi:hypothetical protein
MALGTRTRAAATKAGHYTTNIANLQKKPPPKPNKHKKHAE